MKKRYIFSALGAGVAGLVVRTIQQNKRTGHHEIEGEDATFYKAGKPDQVDTLEVDQLENAKMVSEGSQFGVQYYNHVTEEEEE
ncbi:hypothetical protein [Ornithinibacillus contaminans]|uniref:hypothetical protein n=1 Tax=Ornithinibacillus contaminans TaxID=694055 RepID=UPI00064DEA7E|nr:hypothetical protein [Ornithinibacillus contaminans]